MASLADLFLVFVIVLDLAISIWNAYASGLTWALLRGQPGNTFAKVCAVVGLALAFVGMTYVTLIIISYLALVVGFLGIGDFLFLVAFDFLVFGAMIIGFGAVIAAQSVAIAYRKRNFGAIAVAVWNVFSEVYDVAIYAEGFRDAAGIVSGGGDRRNRANLYAVVAVAVGVAFIITYVAFRHGVRRAEGAIAASPTQSAAGSSASGTLGNRPHHLRNAVVAGVVVVVVVVAAVAAIPYVVHIPRVNVREIDVWAPDNVCGLNSTPISYGGFSDSPGASDAFALQLPNFTPTSCTLHSVVTNTSGFGLSDVQVPVTVAGSQNGTLNLTIELPSSSFDGTLNLVFS